MKTLKEFINKEIDFSKSDRLRGGLGTTCTDVEETNTSCNEGGNDNLLTTYDDDNVLISQCTEWACPGDYPEIKPCITN